MALIERQDIERPVPTRQNGDRRVCQAEVEIAVFGDEALGVADWVETSRLIDSQWKSAPEDPESRRRPAASGRGSEP